MSAIFINLETTKEVVSLRNIGL